jgi:hypothetical protein
MSQYYPDQHGRKIKWPDDWPEPLAGANAGPLANAAKFEAMKEDIASRGLREKIKLTRDGKIAEGRNRYRALRDLEWSHEKIVAEACVVVEATDLDAALSNIMQVNRTNLGLIASYLRAHPKTLAVLLKDRKNRSKSGEQAKLAAVVGCSPRTIVRALEEVEKAEELPGGAPDGILEYLAADQYETAECPAPDGHRAPFAGGEATIQESTGAVASEEIEQKGGRDMVVGDIAPPSQAEKEPPAQPSKKKPAEPEVPKDRRVRVTPEIRTKVAEAFKSGSSKKEIARVFNLSDSTVRSIVAAPEAKRKPAAEDQVSAQLLAIWRKFGQKELQLADVPAGLCSRATCCRRAPGR